MTPLLVFLFLAVFSKHSFSQSTSVSSALKALAMMRYINLRFKLHYITSFGWELAKAGMAHSVSGCVRGVQVKL